MAALLDLQRRFAAALRQDGPPPAEIRGDGLGAAARLALHRNNHQALLAEALADAYPVTRRVAGADFFAGAARAFIRAQPPRGPVLAEWGGGLPDFLAAAEACRPIPFLADLARIDAAVQAAWHAPLPPPLTAADLASLPAAALDDLRLALVPSARLLVSPWPVADLWRQYRAPGSEAEPPRAALDQGGCRLLVWCRGEDVAMADLAPGEAAFLAAFDGRCGLGAAAAAGRNADAGFDLAAALSGLLEREAGLLADRAEGV